MAYKLRKRYQRALNRAIKDLNKNIAEDNLWKGRFYNLFRTAPQLV